MKDLEKLLEVCRFHDQRVAKLNEFKENYLEDNKQKLTKKYYLKLKEMVYTNIQEIQKEIQLWEELGEIIDDQEEPNLPEEYEQILSELHNTKTNAINATAEIIESLQSDIDKNLDLMNMTNETIRLVQEKTKTLSPLYLNVMFMNPDLKMDRSVLEIEL